MKKLKKEIVVVVFAIAVFLCGPKRAWALQEGTVENNVLTFTFESDNEDVVNRYNIYLLANDAKIVTKGKDGANVLPGSDGSGNENITEPIAKGTKTGGLTFTDENGNKVTAASKVEYSYKYRRGVLTVTVKIYDPSPELTGIALVGISSDENANYYSDVGGTMDISGYIKEMYHKEEESGQEQESGKSEEEKTYKEAPEIGIGKEVGKHRPPCILRRLSKLFSA